MKSQILKFLKSEKGQVFLAAFFSGLYPFLFYYSKNYTLVNSKIHFVIYVSVFLIVPIFFFFLVQRLFKQTELSDYIIPFLNMVTFLFFIEYCILRHIHKKWLIVIILFSLGYTYFLHKHVKKIIVIQAILASFALFSLVNILFFHFNLSSKWTQIPEKIPQIKFEKTPNIFFIQPDGHVNFSELHTPPYSYKSTNFESFLNNRGFKNYKDFRGNYNSTLSSNSSIFNMKHHYCQNYSKSLSEMFGARKSIVGKNNVLRILKNNNYTTNFITEAPYFFVNHPDVFYDYSNFNFSEVPIFRSAFKAKKNVVKGLEKVLDVKSKKPSFTFIQFFSPGHIIHNPVKTKGKEKEREKYLTKLQDSHKQLKSMISMILKKDKNALIFILADHGGFVGFDSTSEIFAKTTNPLLVKSAYSSLLSVHWPNNNPPTFDTKLKSSVNVFRIIFAYLTEDESLLDHLEPDESFTILKDENDGVFKYIDNENKTVFEKIETQD